MKPATATATVILGLIAVIQLVRALFKWPVEVNGITIPVAFSYIAFLILTVIVVMAWREAHGRQST